MRSVALALLASTTAAIAPAAQAQDGPPICGGISVVGDWAGGAEGASDVATAEAPLSGEGQVPIAGHLVRMFSLSEPSEVRIEVAARPAGDPYISVYDAGGDEVAADDDSGGNFAARAEVQLEAGTYCLAARSYESGVTDVAFRIGRTDQEALTEGAVDSAPGAAPGERMGTGPGCFEDGVPMLGEALDAEGLSAPLATSATLADAPAVGFDLAAPAAVSITATSDAGDPLITLIDEAGTELAENDDFEGLNSRIDMTAPLPAGRYCVEIDDLNGAYNEIEIGLSAFDPDADRRRRIASGEIMPSAGDEVEIRDLGTVGATAMAEVPITDETAWLAFDLPEAGLLLAETVTPDGDPSLVLFDRVGRRIAFNDDGPDSLESQMVARLFPGRYVIGVRLVDGEGPRPGRVVLERWVPAE